MSINEKEIYVILKGINELGNVQYDRLVSVYGIDLVKMVIAKIVMEDRKNIDKFLNYVSINDLDLSDDKDNDDGKDEYISSYEIYCSDIRNREKLCKSDKLLLIDDIIKLIKRMEELFEIYNCPRIKKGSRRYLWIADRMEEIVDKCNDLEVISELNGIYKEFLNKREKLSSNYLEFVIKIAKEYCREYGVPFLDLVQYGNMGLIRAIEMYNYDYGIEFMTYAEKWIRQSILRGIKRDVYQIRKPEHMFMLRNNIGRAKFELSQKLEREPNIKEVADYLGEDIEKIKLVEESFLYEISLDDIVRDNYVNDEFEFGLSYEEVIGSECQSLEDEIIDKIINMERADSVFRELKGLLTDREKLIMKYRYVDELLFLEIGEKFGYTKAWASLNHGIAMKKIRKKLGVSVGK